MNKVVKKWVELPNKEYPIVVSKPLNKFSIISVLKWLEYKNLKYIVGRDKYGRLVAFREKKVDEYTTSKYGEYTESKYRFDIIDHKKLIKDVEKKKERIK